ncbi:MAG: CHASE2 domain-containing protein [Verrucomicrobiales bacterium]|nr:CHASE2 domain-containing protein [Verrucomicrobiales bacterium]
MPVPTPDHPPTAPSTVSPPGSTGDTHDPRAIAGVLLAVVLGALSLLLLQPESIPGARLTRASYDLTFSFGTSTRTASINPTDSPVATVYLDRRSFDALGQNPGLPLDRAWYARLVRRLTSAGASQVLFDVLFQHPSEDPKSDADFADAIRAHGAVLLGAEWSRSDSVRPDASQVTIRNISLPVPHLLAAAAGYGFVFSRVDPDFVVRRHFPGFLDRQMPSLTWEAARHRGVPIARSTNPPPTPRWINYYGPPLTIPGISFVDALDPNITPDSLFLGKTVLVGTRPTAGLFDERRDEWRSPFSGWGQGLAFMPAVEVHATELLNLIRGDWLRRTSPAMEATAAWIGAFALAFFFVRLRPAPAAAALVGAELIVLIAAAYAFNEHRLWFPWLILAAVQIPGAATGSFVLHSVEWYRQRRRYLARIRQQAALIDKAQDAILVVDLAGQVTYANPRARTLYGWSEPVIDPAAAHRSLEPEKTGAFVAAAKHAATTGEWSGELPQRDANGKPLIVECRATLIRDPNGTPREILFINTDVTERKKLQDQFLRAQRRESIGALAGGMAHDLNNALSPILMGVQMLKAKTTDAAMHRVLSVMESNTQRGAGMVRQVLLFARGQDDITERVSLVSHLHELESVLRQSFPAHIAISVLAPADLWAVHGNATQLHQILLNLCINARDAMPSGGRLTLAADNAELDAAEAQELPGLRPGRHVMLLVSDTGSGIPPEVQAHLFEPFFTTKPQGIGTGLGLATVASLVKNHGGAVRVRSQVGEGTSFEVYLPALEAAPTRPPSETSAIETPSGHGELILLADDELSLRELVRDGLEGQGYKVLPASSAVEALALAREHAADLRLAIVSTRLTNHPTQSLASQLRETSPQLPLLLITGATPAPTPQLPGTPPAHLPKPFTFDALLTQVSRLLHPNP